MASSVFIGRTFSKLPSWHLIERGIGYGDGVHVVGGMDVCVERGADCERAI